MKYDSIACKNCKLMIPLMSEEGVRTGHCCSHPVCFKKSKPIFDSYTGKTKTHMVQDYSWHRILNRFGKCKYFKEKK